MLPPEQFGVARMLTAAGVDRFSIGQRLRSLDPAQVQTLASQYAVQAAAVNRRIEEARLCESFLLQRGYADQLEDELVAKLPLGDKDLAALAGGPPGPFPGREDLIAEILENSPLEYNRDLAALAMLRRGQLARDALARAAGLVGAEGKVGVEAALVHAGWRVRRAPARPSFDVVRSEEALTAARTALAAPALAPYAAVLLALRARRLLSWSSTREAAERELESLVPHLRAGLDRPDSDLRLDCALVLEDEQALAPYADGTDEDMATLARRALGAAHSPLVHRRLVDGPDEARVDILEGLSHPVGTDLLEALLAGAARSGEQFRRSTLRFVRGRRFGEWEPECQAAVGRFCLVHARSLGAKDVLDLLTWATTTTGDWPNTALREGEAVRPFADAATAALFDVPADKSREILGDSDFLRWLAVASGSEADALLDRWASDPATAKRLLESVFWLHGLANRRDQPDARAVSLLEGIWDRTGERRAAVSLALGEVLHDHGGIAGRDAILGALWKRFKEHPGERPFLYEALRSWRQELEELRDSEPPLDGGDPVKFFALWWDADRKDLIRVTDQALARAKSEHLVALTDAVVDAALPIVEKRPRTAIVPVFRTAARIANDFREEPENVTLAAAADHFAERWLPFQERFVQARPETDGESGAEHFVEDVETELRLIAEAAERVAGARRDAEERRRREELRLRREQEQREREEEMRRRQEELLRQAEQQHRQLSPSLTARPLLPPDPVDDAPLVADGPFCTLVDYVRFILRISAGGDVMRLFAEHGLDAQQWARVVEAWSKVMQGNTAAALRMGQLMQASWT